MVSEFVEYFITKRVEEVIKQMNESRRKEKVARIKERKREMD